MFKFEKNRLCHYRFIYIGKNSTKEGVYLFQNAYFSSIQAVKLHVDIPVIIMANELPIAPLTSHLFEKRQLRFIAIQLSLAVA